MQDREKEAPRFLIAMRLFPALVLGDIVATTATQNHY
jgi:hypothetical protein